MRTTADTWVEYGRRLLERDEVYSLAGALYVSQVEAAGYIALLVALGLAEADDDGQVWHLTDKAIEMACYWTGERGALVAAFVACGILVGDRDSDDNPLRIMPGLWDDLAGKTLKQRILARKRKQLERNRKS
jgi:hypothetical protein